MSPIPVKTDCAIGAGLKMAHSGEVRRFSLAQTLEDIVNHPIQAVRSLAAGHSGLPGQLFGDLLFLHPDHNLTGESPPLDWFSTEVNN